MATKKSNDSHRLPGRYSQVFNPATGHFIKRDTASGLFVEIKSDGKPFQGIALEATYVKTNPNVKKSTARKAEMAVMKAKNDKAA